VVKEIRIYIEGGGKQDNQSMVKMRQGFNLFFREIREEARKKNIHIKWSNIPCGPRNSAFEDFKKALQDHPDAFNILLVDAEGPVIEKDPWKHLEKQDGWKLAGVAQDQCYLMTQMMEAWFIADPATLKKYYGQHFEEKKLPKTKNVENIAKADLEKALKEATKNTLKREYHKINHASEILGLLDVSKVRKAAPCCDRLFTVLADKVGV
jgi:hypothetical protein